MPHDKPFIPDEAAIIGLRADGQHAVATLPEGVDVDVIQDGNKQFEDLKLAVNNFSKLLDEVEKGDIPFSIEDMMMQSGISCIEMAYTLYQSAKGSDL